MQGNKIGGKSKFLSPSTINVTCLRRDDGLSCGGDRCIEISRGSEALRSVSTECLGLPMGQGRLRQPCRCCRVSLVVSGVPTKSTQVAIYILNYRPPLDPEYPSRSRARPTCQAHQILTALVVRVVPLATASSITHDPTPKCKGVPIPPRKQMPLPHANEGDG
jgi:hypothetical protein